MATNNENNLEFKVLDVNQDFMGHLFDTGGGVDPAPATPPAQPAAVLNVANTTPAQPAQPQQQQPNGQQAQQPATPQLKPEELITSDDLLAAIGNIDEPAASGAAPAAPAPTAPAAAAQSENKGIGATQTPTQPAKPAGLPEGLSDDDVKMRNYLYTKHMIDTGVWQDIEEIEKIDFTVDNFKRIIEIQTGLQTQNQVAEKWNTIKSSDKMVETLLDYIENEKDPSEILQMYREQKELQGTLNFETIEGNVDAIRKFYTEKATPRWSMEKTNKYIKGLELEGEDAVKAEGNYVKDQYGEVFEAERKAKVAATQAETQAKEDQRKRDIQSHYQLLTQQGFNDKDAKKLLTDIYQPKYKQDGKNEMLTELDAKLLALKKDPAAYMEYVQFVLDPTGFKKALTAKKAEQVTNDIWANLKTGNGAKGTGENVTVSNRNTSANDPYKDLLKK